MNEQPKSWAMGDPSPGAVVHEHVPSPAAGGDAPKTTTITLELFGTPGGELEELLSAAKEVVREGGGGVAIARLALALKTLESHALQAFESHETPDETLVDAPAPAIPDDVVENAAAEPPPPSETQPDPEIPHQEQ